MAEWSDQVAVVTGGARGIGRASAELLAKHGAAVCVNYVAHAEAAETLAKELLAGGARAVAVGGDVSDPKAVEAMIARTEAELGPVTILVNNAGIALQATLDTFDAAQFARMREINVDGVIHATRAVMAGMRARRYGRIVISARSPESEPHCRAMRSMRRPRPRSSSSRGASRWSLAPPGSP